MYYLWRVALGDSYTGITPLSQQYKLQYLEELTEEDQQKLINHMVTIRNL